MLKGVSSVLDENNLAKKNLFYYSPNRFVIANIFGNFYANNNGVCMERCAHDLGVLSFGFSYFSKPEVANINLRQVSIIWLINGAV